MKNTVYRLLGIDDWSLYHRLVLYLVIILIGLCLYQAWYARADGSYHVEDRTLINAPASAVWPFVIENENRVRWLAHIIEVHRLAKEPDVIGSTRLLYWREPKNFRRWTAFESTDALVPERRFQVIQKSDKDERIQEVTLEPVGPCKTRVTIKERIRYDAYGRRLISPLLIGRDYDRLAESLKALNRWAADVSPACYQ